MARPSSARHVSTMHEVATPNCDLHVGYVQKQHPLGNSLQTTLFREKVCNTAPNWEICLATSTTTTTATAITTSICTTVVAIDIITITIYIKIVTTTTIMIENMTTIVVTNMTVATAAITIRWW